MNINNLKIICFLIVIFLIPNFSFAANKCSKDGYIVTTINGVLTNDKGAEENMLALEKVLGFNWKNQSINYRYLLNPSHIAGALDFVDAFKQGFFGQKSDYDLIEMLNDASNKISTQKVLLVGHSQGNFYANNFYDKVAGKEGGIPTESLGVYSVATPADHVGGEGKYITSDTDKAIAGVAGDIFSILPPNAHIDLQQGDNFLGHNFDIYLKYQTPRIVSDIQSSLDKLQTNNIQNENASCMNPPKLTLGHKIEGLALAVADSTADVVKNGIVLTYDTGVFIVNGIYNTSLAVGNAVIQGVNTVASSISSFAQSIFNKNENLAVNNTASAISAIEGLADVSPNSAIVQTSDTTNLPTPEQVINTKENIPTMQPAPETQVVSNPLHPAGGGSGNRVNAEIIIPEEVHTEPIVEPVLPSDNIAPAISVIGANPVNINIGDAFIDGGATAIDDVDGPINVFFSGVVNNWLAGNYVITYTAKDKNNNTATATRTVNVADAFPSISLSSSDLNNNGIPDNTESDVTMDSNATLPAGEYYFNNLNITNNAVLTVAGDPLSVNSFKGVKITVSNLNVNSGSYISADQKGYNSGAGLGISSEPSVGASYGGFSFGGASTSSLYGSATKPIDLGSGGADFYNGFGGGAIRIVVSDTFTNNGIISSSGAVSASGGSIFVTANKFTGNGIFRANGGNLHFGDYFKSPGGGGRIALYYKTSSFSGTLEAKGGCGSYDGWSSSCGQVGTMGIFDSSANDAYLSGSWQFRNNDAPFAFNNIYILNDTKATSENNVNITANNLVIDKNSFFSLSDNQVLNIPTIKIDGVSTLTLSGSEIIMANSLMLMGNSILTIIPEKILALNVSNINIEKGSSISADFKGYGVATGLGAPSPIYDPENPGTYMKGASYGGLGSGSNESSIYGSASAPVDFGSGGNGSLTRGGGAIRLIANNLINNGTVSAGGNITSSGGSIYITTNTLDGDGIFQAKGGGTFCPAMCYGAGGGGRVALYYKTSSFTGQAVANGWSGYGGDSKEGTVVSETID